MSILYIIYIFADCTANLVGVNVGRMSTHEAGKTGVICVNIGDWPISIHVSLYIDEYFHRQKDRYCVTIRQQFLTWFFLWLKNDFANLDNSRAIVEMRMMCSHFSCALMRAALKNKLSSSEWLFVLRDLAPLIFNRTQAIHQHLDQIGIP